jgi:hypothetical protein
MGVDQGYIDELLGATDDNDLKELSISKSFITSYWDYRRGDKCGILFRDVDILKNASIESTPPMMLGNYFEYLATGQVNRDGSVPEMPQTKTKKPTADAVRMMAQAKRFKKLVEEKGIVIKETGTTLIHERDGYRVKGVLDVLCDMPEYGQENVILDLKSSGLIGNKWEDYGWKADTLNQRDKLTIQVVAYKYLMWKCKDIEDAPFYFAIHSSANDIDSLFWEVEVENFAYAMSEFESLCDAVHEDVRNYLEFGFTPYPTVRRCEKCPIKDDCSYAMGTPEKETIIIDGIFRKL